MGSWQTKMPLNNRGLASNDPRAIPPSCSLEMTFVKQESFSVLYLHSLDLQFHVVLSGRFAIFPLFPAIPIFPVFHFLPVVENHGAILGSGNNKWLSYQENQARKKFMKKDITDQ